MTKDKACRVQFSMPERSLDRLKALTEMTEASSYSEVVRHALQLYEAAVKEKMSGGKVFVKRADGTEAPVF